MLDTSTAVLRSPQITLDEIKAKAGSARLLVYGANTCWWRILGEGEPIGYERPAPDLGPNPAIRRADGSRLGLPCDPRGGMLFQLDGPEEIRGFIAAAEANPNRYGRHGLAAFVASYHGNVVTSAGLPTCFRTWDEYNALLDGARS